LKTTTPTTSSTRPAHISQTGSTANGSLTLEDLAREFAQLKARLTAPAAPVLDSLLTAQELAARLGHKSTRNVDEWRKNGSGPKYIRAGRTPYYRPEDVDEWLMKNRYANTGEEL
jgi:hypothetical protein